MFSIPTDTMLTRLKKTARRLTNRRSLRAEPLERRQLMAGDLLSGNAVLHNTSLPQDVNNDGYVSALDALVVMNQIQRDSGQPTSEGLTVAGLLGGSTPAESEPRLVDVDDSGSVTARDVLLVINFLRQQRLAEDASTAGNETPTEETPAEESPAESPVGEPPVDEAPAVDAEPAAVDPVNDNCFTVACLLHGGGTSGQSPTENTEEENSSDQPAEPPPEAVDVVVTTPSPSAAVSALPADLIYADFAKDPSVDSQFVATFNHAFKLNGLNNEITASEVGTLLERASAATRSDDAIIAVVDRNGTILGVRVEAGVNSALRHDQQALAFAIDGAVAKARTAAFFASNAAPLTSRTIRSLSQSTNTQREVESSPVETDLRYRGPGLVAPIGVGGKFPPEVNFTPQVDLFAIEHQSRDSQIHAGSDGEKGTDDDFVLRTRFNADPAFIPTNAEAFFQTWPESYGVQSGIDLTGQSRGIATLPGGIPLFKAVTDADGNPVTSPVSKSINLVGGIGVFFPGEDGYAMFEQEFQHGVYQTEKARTNADKILEAEFAALIAAAGNRIVAGDANFARDVSSFNADLPPLPNFVVPIGRIDLVGITLEVYGPNPSIHNRQPGIDTLLDVGRAQFGGASFVSGTLEQVTPGGDTLLGGQPVPEGWLVAPHTSKVDLGLTAEFVEQIIDAGVAEAQRTRAAIRLDLDSGFRPGARTSMVLSVADKSGELLGLFRMPDATIFSIDVSVAKSRNTAYYADPADLQDVDRLDFNGDGQFGPTTTSLRNRTGDTLPLGTALTNRTFRFVVEPRFPSGIEINPGSATIAALQNHADFDLCTQNQALCNQVAPQSILRLPGINPVTAENLINDQPLPFDVYGSSDNSFSVLAYDSFVPSRNFRDPGDATVFIHGDGTLQPLANQNGIVFFPGSTPLYLNDDAGALVGGLGVSGDGVDQDDVVTVAGQQGFAPPAAIRVDQYILAGVRLPFQKFNRSPFSA